jgi:hypothetical protein
VVDTAVSLVRTTVKGSRGEPQATVKTYMSKQLRVRGCRKSEAANRRTDKVVTVLTAVDKK